MALRLTLENEKQLPDGGPTTFALNGKRSIEIGRDQFLDWVLPDPTRVVSGKHCEIKWQDGSYWLSDTSTNGTFLNGADHRVQSPARLRDGDRLTIGPYIVAVAIDEQEQPRALPRAVGLDEIWGSEAASVPPIDPKLLKPAQPAVAADDYLEKPVDLPWVDRPLASAESQSPPAQPNPGNPNVDWLSSLVKPTAPSPAQPGSSSVSITPRPSPHFASDADSPWLPAQPSPRPAEEARPPTDSPAPGGAAATSPSDSVSDRVFLQRFAQGAGLPDNLLDGRDGGDFAESLGKLLREVAGGVKQLLDARQSAKRISRTADQTTISAFDNNPLKFSPTIDDALVIMFGPPKRSYLDAARCFESSFKDLAEHQLLTFSAMQRAMQLMQRDLEPKGIEASVKDDKGLAAIMGSRNARLWDAYVQRWRARTERFDDGLVGAFLRDFAACYDDPQKGR